MARILVVDDNVRLARTLASYLEMEGHSVEQAHDGDSALNVAVSTLPDVVVLDINIPNLDGFEVCRMLKTTFPGLAVLILSGRGGTDDEREAARAGAAEHLTKPVSLSALKAAIHRALAVQ